MITFVRFPSCQQRQATILSITMFDPSTSARRVCFCSSRCWCVSCRWSVPWSRLRMRRSSTSSFSVCSSRSSSPGASINSSNDAFFSPRNSGSWMWSSSFSSSKRWSSSSSSSSNRIRWRRQRRPRRCRQRRSPRHRSIRRTWRTSPPPRSRRRQWANAIRGNDRRFSLACTRTASFLLLCLAYFDVFPGAGELRFSKKSRFDWKSLA